ncbi:MAG TPA: GMC family oxidoreductase [Myxococcaceae bacterium]|nr:GMC family oxidoreductase [Myxococcaceae bacterium]
MEVISKPEPYDAIVVGSGATGGVAAWRLTEGGLRVLVLEAGPALKGGHSTYGSQGTNMMRQVFRHFFSDRQRVQETHPGYWESNPDLFVDDKDNPYTHPKDQPYHWIRGRHVGGRSHTWGGVCLRFSNYELKSSSRDGWGEDWPISTEDLSPHYEGLERFFAVHGSREGLEQLPDGAFVEARPLTSGEQVMKKVVEEKFGRRMFISRGIRARRHHEKGEKFTKLSSPGTTLAAANATGRLTLQTDAVVSRVLVDPNTGMASGVEYVDRESGERREARAKLVFLCASTIESVRILMSSKDANHPEGLGGASGVLGRGLMDHISSNNWFFMPDVPDEPGHELLGSDSILIPRWVNVGSDKQPFMRGFGMWGGIQRMPIPGFLRRKRGIALGFLCAMGEALPNPDSRLVLDENVKDRWGLPVPHLACRWMENDLAVAKAGREAAIEMITAAGGVMATLPDLLHTPLIGEFMKGLDDLSNRSPPGLFVHEVGGARMGSNPKSSVVDPHCRVWDAPNVYVTDGACWVSSGWQNPTLTEMAITARAAAHAVATLRGEEPAKVVAA